MKLVAILGSPRGMRGNTGLLMEGLLQGARDSGAEVEVFSLSEWEVHPCRGCEACHLTGKCPIKDDFARIYGEMAEADGLVLASPNYVLSVSAQMKALLDRSTGAIHLRAFEGKYAAAVVTSGSPEQAEVEEYLLRALRVLSFTTVGSVGALGWQMAQDTTRAPYLDAAAALGHKLVEAIRTRQAFPEQDEQQQMWRDRFRQLITAQKDRWKYEYACLSAQ